MRTPPSQKGRLPAGPVVAASLSMAPIANADQPRNVVIVHGIWDTSSTLHKMDAALRKEGFSTTIVSLTPNNGRVGLDTLALQMRSQIDRSVPGHQPFSIVAFSMGGLVARSYMRQFGDPGRLATFISISSPHQGTWTAWLLGNAAGRDMRPHSSFLAAVDADAARYHATRWITVRTPFDLIILPPASSILPWASNHSFLVPLHPLMVWDGRVIKFVLAELQKINGTKTKSPPRSAAPARSARR